MVNYGSMLNMRPYNCRFCIQGWSGMRHLSQQALARGISLIDLTVKQVEYGPVRVALTAGDPIFVNGFGHGSNTTFTGDSETMIFDTTHCSELAGRIVYLLSCQTANSLGPAIIAAGGLAYGGYNISWSWYSVCPTDCDPYGDKYAEGFYRASNEFVKSLIEGNTVEEAETLCIAEYNRWIDIWTNHPDYKDDLYAASIISTLIFDRNGLTVLGDTSAKIYDGVTPTPDCTLIDNEVDCGDCGDGTICFWGGNCHQSTVPPPTGKRKKSKKPHPHIIEETVKVIKSDRKKLDNWVEEQLRKFK